MCTHLHILLFQLPFNILKYLFPLNEQTSTHTHTRLGWSWYVYIFLITEHNYKKKNNLKIKLNSRKKRLANGGMEWPNKTNTSLSLIRTSMARTNELFAVFLWNISPFLASLFTICYTQSTMVLNSKHCEVNESRQTCLSLQTTDCLCVSAFFVSFFLFDKGRTNLRPSFLNWKITHTHTVRKCDTQHTSLLCISFYPTANKIFIKSGPLFWHIHYTYTFIQRNSHFDNGRKSLKCCINTHIFEHTQSVYVGMYFPWWNANESYLNFVLCV